jgi:transposase
MRYAQGGGLTAQERERREQVRLRAVRMFEEQLPPAQIARELRVTARSVCRWRQAWLAGGPAGAASRGQAPRCRLDAGQLARLEQKLRAGPLAAGYRDQRWTLARVRDLIAADSGVQYTLPGVWYLLRRSGWSCQMGARRAAERDEARVEDWKARTWTEVKRPRRPSAPGSSSKTRPASR